MAKVVVSEFVTLDGVMEDPGGAEAFDRGGWAFQFERGEVGDKFKFDELMAAEAMLLGRVTYEGFAKAWPAMKDEAGFAEKMNNMAKYVVSGTLENPEWNNSTVIGSDVVGQVERLKGELEGDVLVAGSARLVHALTANGLVDEYRLMVFPVALGAGKRLFTDAEQASKLRMVQCERAGDCLVATYEPLGES